MSYSASSIRLSTATTFESRRDVAEFELSTTTTLSDMLDTRYSVGLTMRHAQVHLQALRFALNRFPAAQCTRRFRAQYAQNRVQLG